jgi:two-component system chemotaxis response regulator CheB
MSPSGPPHLADRVIVIGGSAGSLEPIATLLRSFTPQCRAAVLVVVHIPESSPSMLHRVLGRGAELPVVQAVDGALLEAAQVYVAVPGHHLVVEDDHLRTVLGPRENGLRPAIDPLFRSAAAHWDSRVAGVVVSGALDDGSAGLLAVVREGGRAFVQAPDEAGIPDMPAHAIAAVPSATVGTIAELGTRLSAWCDAPETTWIDGGDGGRPAEAPPDVANGPVEYDVGDPELEPTLDTPSGFICPDCGGSLFEIVPGRPLKFRCRVGHAWTASTLGDRHHQALENAVWEALRIIEDDLALQDRLAERAQSGSRLLALERIEERRRHRLQLRESLLAALEEIGAVPGEPVVDGPPV